jgi:pimeloyl-ACP methyl ester carboxylesterase
MGFGQQFFLQTRILRKRYRCILHDLRGCGLSGKPQADSMAPLFTPPTSIPFCKHWE